MKLNPHGLLILDADGQHQRRATRSQKAYDFEAFTRAQRKFAGTAAAAGYRSRAQHQQQHTTSNI